MSKIPQITFFWNGHNCFFISAIHAALSLNTINDYLYKLYSQIPKNDESINHTVTRDIAAISDFLTNYSKPEQVKLVINHLFKHFEHDETLVEPDGTGNGDLMLFRIIDAITSEYKDVPFTRLVPRGVRPNFYFKVVSSYTCKNDHTGPGSKTVIFNLSNGLPFIELNTGMISDNIVRIETILPNDLIIKTHIKALCPMCGDTDSIYTTSSTICDALIVHIHNGYKQIEKEIENVCECVKEMTYNGNDKKSYNFLLKSILFSTAVPGRTGHYWNYMLCKNNQWYKFDKNEITPINTPNRLNTVDDDVAFDIKLFYDVNEVK